MQANTMGGRGVRVALITGASSGIGRAIALALAGAGVTLCLVGRYRPALDAVARSVAAMGARALIYLTDLAVDEQIFELIPLLTRDVGAVDLLVHCAGIIFLGPIRGSPVEELDLQYKVNLRAPYLLTQQLLPQLESTRGKVVFINSSVGLAAKPNLSQYAATKHGLRALADSLRAEVNAAGVRVISVYAGRTATPMQAAIHKWQGAPYHPTQLLQPEDIAKMVVDALSMSETAEITDLQIRPRC